MRVMCVGNSDYKIMVYGCTTKNLDNLTLAAGLSPDPTLTF